jgi:chromate transporter
VAIIGGGALVGRWLLAGSPARPSAKVPSPISARLGVACLVAFGVLLVAIPLLRAVDGQTVALVDAFYRAGSLVFGGGHVVLPLLHASVVDPGWVTEDQFLAGYGAAQAVPGPLFTVAAYLGAVAAPAPNGVAGAAIALGAIFLPSFLLVFGVLPFWDRLARSGMFRRSVAGTNAAVVGILLAALYTPILTSAVRNPLDVAIASAGFALLSTGRVPPIAVVAGCALAGQLVGAG